MSRGVVTVSPDASTKPLFGGIDVGGTSVKYGLVDDAGRSLGKGAIPTQEHDGPAVAMDRSAAAFQSLVSDLGLSLDDVAAIGLGTPGPQNVKTGEIIAPDNLPHWRNFAIRDYLSGLCGGKMVAFANDANAAAFGECWVGGGKEHETVVMFTLGTGVGGGVVIGDRLVEGDHSHGGELGHVIIDYHDDARWCASGQGRLEAYASATALVARAREALDAGRASLLGETTAETLTPVAIWKGAEQGDALALELILETAFYLGIGVVTVMHAIDPGAVVIGGAMTFGGNEHDIGRAFLEKVRDVVRERAFPIPAKETRVEFATLGGDAGYIGAAGIARAAWRRSRA